MPRGPGIYLQRGDAFDRLTIIEKIHGPGNKYKCRCNCADKSVVAVAGKLLVNGHTKSCGCLRREITITRNKARRIYPKGHRKSHTRVTRLYNIWSGIKYRTTNSNSKDWKNYGGRGITMYRPWREDFAVFREYVLALPNCPKNAEDLIGSGNKLTRTIDRHPDKNAGYKPGNIRWATFRRQRHNSRQKIIWVEYEGKNIKLVRLCRWLGLNLDKTTKRLKTGWTLDQAIGKIRPPNGFLYHRQLGWLNLSRTAKLLGLTRDLVHYRMRLGWSKRRAVELSRRQFLTMFNSSKT